MLFYIGQTFLDIIQSIQATVQSHTIRMKRCILRMRVANGQISHDYTMDNAMRTVLFFQMLHIVLVVCSLGNFIKIWIFSNM
ncbi:hypothetical protein HMPREF1985_00921 [Mitsuokella sp. oral taxon 131 str. W9106]|nr:hypothetical protein HMPREF1985_00921 [Mitsuokella sp. oral taxon 131 str. W9106]